MADDLRRWALGVVVAGLLIGSLSTRLDDSPPPRTETVVERVPVLSARDRRLLEAVRDAVTSTTAPLPQPQREAVERATDTLRAVEEGTVRVDPPTTTTAPAPTTTTSTATAVPTTTVLPGSVTEVPWVPPRAPVSTVPPPDTVSVP